MIPSPLSPEEQAALVDAAVSEAAPAVHRALARRLVAPEDQVAVLADDGVYLLPRADAVRLLGGAALLRPLAAQLGTRSTLGRLWVLYLRTDSGVAPALRELAIDPGQLTVRRTSLAQEQFLDAFLLAAGPQIRAAVATYLHGVPGRSLDPGAVAVFLHDTGAGIIEVRTLRVLLRDHGFLRESDLLATAPRQGHLWVWVSSWEQGGAVGLRQVALSETAAQPRT